jgi:hypothetical protein
MAEMCSGKFNVIRNVNYQHHQHPNDTINCALLFVGTNLKPYFDLEILVVIDYIVNFILTHLTLLKNLENKDYES